MPLSFLSGTFYSTDRLPGLWRDITHWNPFFFLIDGLRSAMTGLAPTLALRGVVLLIGCNIVLWLVTHVLIARGYRLKN